ncbi:MAG TPA: hypothetical protein EYQ02_14025, partial [Microbacterium sp.]|nr:hypothetical protein [Microbacterium sp.]
MMLVASPMACPGRKLTDTMRTTMTWAAKESGAAGIVIDGAVLTANPGSQTLRVLGDGSVFAAYGRTADVQAWLADTTYNQVVQTEDGSLVTEEIEPTPEPEPTVDPTATPATDAPTEDGAAAGDAAT